MVSSRPLISRSSIPIIPALKIAPSATFSIAIIVTFLFHSFFSFQPRSKYLSLFSFSLVFSLWSAEITKSMIRRAGSLFLLLIIIWSGLLVGIRLSVCIWKFLQTNYYDYYYYYYYLLFESFFKLVLAGFFTGVSVTASLFKFLGLFSEFSPFSVML